jgi:hypothetical protein
MVVVFFMNVVFFQRGNKRAIGFNRYFHDAMIRKNIFPREILCAHDTYNINMH